MSLDITKNSKIYFTSDQNKPKKPPVTKAVILVGGWGTRLRPLTYTMPKPLINFCNQPILRYQVEKLAKAGIKEVILALNYYSEQIIEAVKEYENDLNIKIIYSKEDQPLGTAGPLALIKNHLKYTSFFLLNSDIACNADLSNMIEEYMKTDALGTILTYEVEDPTRYGLIYVENNKIKSFLEKPKKVTGNGPWIINAGMYILSHEVLQDIELREMSIEKDIFPKLASIGVLSAYRLDGYWMDIGQPKDYLNGQRLALMNESIVDEKSTDLLKKDNNLNNGYSDKINNVVVGKNVTIGKNVKLSNCVIFDNAILEDNVVITDSLIGWNVHVKSNAQVTNTSVLGEKTIVEQGLILNKCVSEPNTKILVSQ